MMYSPKNRLMLMLLLLLAPLVMAGENAVGVYNLDAKAIQDSALKEVRAEFEKNMDGKTEEVRQQLEKQWVGMESQVKGMLAVMTIRLEIKKDGTFDVNGKAGANEMSAKGTWKWQGDKLMMTTTESDGKPETKPEEVAATLKDGVLRMKPDANTPFEFIMIKEKN